MKGYPVAPRVRKPTSGSGGIGGGGLNARYYIFFIFLYFRCMYACLYVCTCVYLHVCMHVHVMAYKSTSRNDPLTEGFGKVTFEIYTYI